MEASSPEAAAERLLADPQVRHFLAIMAAAVKQAQGRGERAYDEAGSAADAPERRTPPPY